MQNQLVKKEATFSSFLTSEGVKTKINEIVGGKGGQRFMTAIISAVSTNPALAECENSTLLSAALLGESLKLSPSPQMGHYYMVPFKKKDRSGNIVSIKATFIVGYKGLIQLAIRSAQYKYLNVMEVRQGEFKGLDSFTGQPKVEFIEDYDKRMKLPVIGYFAYFELINGFRKSLFWTKSKMEGHADQYSPAFKMAMYKKLEAGEVPKSELWKYSSFWYKDFDSMAFKTLLRQLITKWGIMSIEMQTAFERDESEDNKHESESYVEDVTPEPTPEEPKEENIDPITGEILDGEVNDDPLS